MQEITKKIKDNAMKDFMPLIEQMASEGMDKDGIVRAFKAHIDGKTADYYRKIPKKLCAILQTMDFKATPESKAEAIFYKMLEDRGIKFQFQANIGPYRADYLFDDSVVFEIDGPQHVQSSDDRRDKYLRRMGYKVIRVPLWVLTMDAGAVIDTIMDALGGSN